MVSLLQDNLDCSKIVATQKYDHKIGEEGSKKQPQLTPRADEPCLLPLPKYSLNSWMCALWILSWYLALPQFQSFIDNIFFM